MRRWRANRPLTREIRAGLHQASEGPQPKCRSVVYGVGGLPLRQADIVALCANEPTDGKGPLSRRAALRDAMVETVAPIVERAAEAAAITVSRAGAQPPTTAELAAATPVG